MEKEQENKPSLPIANVICIKWGRGYYTAEDVNRLYRMVQRNTAAHAVRFYCFTEIPDGLDPAVIVKPLPQLNVAPEDNKYAYRKEAGLCDDNLGGSGGLTGQRVFFFDLDVVITGSLDEMFDYPKADDFVIINDWNTRGDRVGQASCYSWVVGTLGFVKAYFEAHPKEVVKKFYTASQEYLSAKVIEKWGRLNFWPEPWCRSFKVHALPPGLLRRFVSPKLPDGTKVLCFHGHPKIDDAIAGRWAPPGTEPLWKILTYKTTKPAAWLSNYF